MIKTSPSDDIDAFLDFMSQMIGPYAVRDRVGALSDDVRRFASMIGLPLPSLYVGYLREFGERDSALKMAEDNTSRLTALLEFYEQQRLAETSEIPPNAVVIGVYGLSGECVLVYPPGSEGSIPSDVAEPTVAFSTIGEIISVCAETFRNHLYNQAVARGTISEGSFFSLRREDAAFLHEARRICESLGFCPYWFSDNYVVSLERDDRAVIRIVRKPSRTTLYGRFPTKEARNDLRSFLIRHYDLTDNAPNAP